MAPVTLVLCIVLMSGISSAQNTTIEVDFDSAPLVNNKFSITVPRVDAVVFTSNSSITNVPRGEDFVLCSKTSETTCSLDLINDPRDVYRLELDGPFDTSMTVQVQITINVNETYNVACSQYVFPVKLNISTMTGSFSCVPVFVNPPTGSVDNIVWYRSNFTNGSDALPVNASRVGYLDIDGVERAFVNFTTAMSSDGGYYFPVTGGVDPADLSTVLPITVAYQPVITSKIAEFSVDFYLNPSIPANHTFSCSIHSFPMSSVMWRYTADPNSEMPINRTLPCPQCPDVLLEEGPRMDTNETFYNITIVGVSFESSGIYTCVAENAAFTVSLLEQSTEPINAHSYRIRVKDHLRQLWPAVVTIVVIILVVIAISLGALFDFVVGKVKGKDEPARDNQRTFSVTSNSSSDGQVNTDHMALRRLSSARVQLLEEPR